VELVSANVNIANNSGGSNRGSSNGGSKTGVSITSNDEFKFWSKIQDEIGDLVNRPEDSYQSTRAYYKSRSWYDTSTGPV